MSHRRKHRATATARRKDRHASGVEVDPSNRTARGRRGFWCPGCGQQFRTPSATRMHFLLQHVPNIR